MSGQWGDDPTPVQTPNPLVENEALKVQNADLRRQLELWRPIVETARIVTMRSKTVTNSWSSLADSIEMLGRMIEAADAAQEDDHG